MTQYEVRAITEIPLEDVPEREFEIIRSAFGPDSRFRTISGIHDETGILSEHILAVLVHSGIARPTPFTKEPGQIVYARADEPKTFMEILARIRWAQEH